MKGGKSKKKVEIVKPDFAPPRELLEKPKTTPEQEYRELKDAHDARAGDYFPDAVREKITNIIELFDRDNKHYVVYSELRDILIATNNVYEDEELLKGIYKLIVGQGEVEGLTTKDVFIILSKKHKDNDKKRDLMDAFGFVNADAPQPPPEAPEEERTMMKSEKFYDNLIYNGYRYTDEMADVVLKEADPKNKGVFGYDKFVDNVIKTEKKKKKKGKKKK